MSESETPSTPTPDADDASEMGQAAVQVTSQKGNDERGTPPTFVRKLKNAIGGMFDLDPCSGAEPQPIATTRFTKEDNGLAQDWRGYNTVFVNPPYSDLKAWLKKVEREATRDDPEAPDLVICLLPGNTSTQWFQKYAAKGDYLCLIEGRLTFHGTDQSAPFASILSVFGNDLDDDVLSTIGDMGTLYTKAEVEQAREQARLDDMFSTDGGAAAATGGSTPPLSTTVSCSGPSIRDVSSEAPAVPQGIISFHDVGLNDTFHLEVDDSVMGVPESVPTNAKARVITGEHATDDRTLTPDEWDTLLCVDEETETYFCLSQDPDDLGTIHCSVAPDGMGWETVPLKTLHRLETNGPTVIEPHGEGTSYVC